MSISTFIFSEERKVRIMRHLLFWILWTLYFAILHAANPFLEPQSSYFKKTEFTTVESLLFMIPQIIVAYLVLYFILPMYTQKGKIVQPIIWGIACWFACGALNLFMVQKINPVILNFLLSDELLANT